MKIWKKPEIVVLNVNSTEGGEASAQTEEFSAAPGTLS